MESTFDNKIYDILKNGSEEEEDQPEEEEEEDVPDPVEFNDVYPVGTVVTTNTSTCPFTTGTWELTGLYGVVSPDHIQNFTFSKDYVLWHAIIDASGSTQYKINFNDYFGDCTVKFFLGPSYRSPQNASEPNNNLYDRFYDDKGGWYGIIDGSQITIKGAGLADRTRKYDITVLIELNSFDQSIAKYSDNDVAFEFTRTA